MKKIIYSLLVTVIAACAVFGQSSASLKKLCPNSGVYATVKFDVVGNEIIAPCAAWDLLILDVTRNGKFALDISPSSQGLGAFQVGVILAPTMAEVYVNENSNAITFGNATTTGTSKLSTIGVSNWQLQKTITPIGTTGDIGIDKPAGTVNVALGADAVKVSNGIILDDSIILATLRTADATCTHIIGKAILAGEVTFTLNAACTAATSIGFLVLN